MNSLDPLVIYIGNPLYRGNVHIYPTEARFMIIILLKRKLFLSKGQLVVWLIDSIIRLSSY